MFAKYLKFIVCVSLAILILPVASSFVDFETDMDSGSTLAQLGLPDAELTAPVPRSIGSRATHNYQDTLSNDPNDGATRFSESGDLLRGDVKNGRLHWFMTTAFQGPPPTGKPYNITIMPSVPINWNDWVIVRLYVFWDFDYDDYIDDKEMVLLHQESYSGSSSTRQPCWGLTSHEGDYYVCVEGRPNNPANSLQYTLTVTWTPQDPPAGDINYDITKALPITQNTAQPQRYIDMDLQPFDWYVIEAPTDSQMFGINVTVRLKFLNPIPPMYSDGLGTTFVTELLVVILHERATDPEGDLIFGGVDNASKHSITKLPKSIWYYNVQTWFDQSDRISRSYIGVFATTYGIDTTSGEHRFFDLDFADDVEDDYVNSYTTYSWIKVNSEPVIRPIIRAVKTYSLRTNTDTGKTYDQFRFQCEYYSKPNYAPLIFRVYIYPPDSTRAVIIRNMLPVDPENTNFRTSPEFIYTIDGLELGEGCFKYQIDCWDRHTYATNSKAEKVIYDGPCVRNNIPPQIRKTAADTIEMMEDDKPLVLRLSDFFIDVDKDDMTFYLVDDEGNISTFYEPLEPENKILMAQIFDNERLKLTPKENKFGNCFITIVASDFPAEVNATLKIEVIIAPVNDPPQIKNKFTKWFLFGEIWFHEDTNFTDLNLHDIFWDPIEYDPLTFTVTGNENVFVNIAENGSVRFTAKPNWHGMEVLTFTATDPPGGFVSNELKVSVESVNDAPILNQSAPIICYEESWTNLTFEAWDPADDDPLVFTSNIAIALNLKPEDYTFNKDTGELNLFPPNRVATGNNYTVTVWVYDNPVWGKSITVSTEVEFVVRNKWDPPVPRIIQPSNGDIFLHFESIEFIGLCLDDDLKVPDLEEKITYEWYSDIDGKIGDTDVVRNVMLSPGSTGQQHTITLRVSDGKYSDSTKIKIWVVKEERKDSDGDGMPDYWEDRNHLNKFDQSDADGDPDKDNYTNLQEYVGEDGIGETPPSYDPWDSTSHPERPPDEKTKEEFDILWPGVGLIIVILIMAICLMLTLSFISRKVRDARDYSSKRYELEERIKREEREKEEEKYGIYSEALDLDVLCHSCGTRNKVHSTLRPLAVRCDKCNQRGVIY